MAIDLEALRAKHEQLNNPQAGNSNSDFLQKFYQIPEGTNAVRILPWKDESREFYAETKIHRVPQPDGTVKNIHCRKIHGEKCPMCDLYYGLWKTGKQEDEDLARKIKPRARYYMNILDRASGDVKILSIGVILFKKIIGAMLDEDFGDITDPESGHDFKIVKEMDGQWPKYDQSAPRPKSSELGSKAETAATMDSLHEIHDLVKLEDYEEVKKATDMLIGVAVQGTSTPEPTEEVSDNDYLSKLQG
jgi:hypothetical protein|tara:strand:+ start:3472 stop:4212 length:741 start_codon:yes stop_codon:yes gene_type:complete